jgi:hypothetical protein
MSRTPPAGRSAPYRKAIAAGILGALGTAAVGVQAAATDSSITGAEWGTIGIAFVTALASTLGVYATTNKPAAAPPTTYQPGGPTRGGPTR